jgi:hypothetical protein
MFDPLALDLASWSQSGFQSQQHMMQAMSHPQYRINPEYRAAVEAKVCLESGNLGFQTANYTDTQRSDSDVDTAEVSESAASRQRNADYADAERALAEQHGEHAVRPGARIATGQQEPRYEVEGTQRASVSTM